MSTSKANLIGRLQRWMDTKAGQMFLNYAYSWGASIVILGALFKLTHIAGADIMLFLGMGTEVILKADGAWISMWFVEDEETGEKYRSLGADCFVTSNAARTRPGFRVQHGPAGATVGGEKRCKTDK